MLARALLLALAPLVAACPICPDPEMSVVSGSTDVAPRELVQLRARYGGWKQGPERCGGHWSVNGVELGNDMIGRIDDCGLYVAPAVFPDDLQAIEIVASEAGPDQCADCCQFAAITLRPVR